MVHVNRAQIYRLNRFREALPEDVFYGWAPADGSPVGPDQYWLRRPDGRTALVPFVKAIVPEVDVAGGRVVLAPPEGLFDL